MKNARVHLSAMFCIVMAFSLLFATPAVEASSANISTVDELAIAHSAMDSCSAASAQKYNMPSVMTQWQVTAMIAVDWTNIVQVEAGYRHTVGLRADGTVVAVRDSVDTDYGECNVDGWTDIVQVSAGAYHTVGLRADGTAVATGRNENGECNVSGWTDIIQISAGGALAAGHTVGLKADGTVVAMGWNMFGQCDVGDWTDIIQVSAGRHFTVGLRTDGTAVAVGRNYYGQCDVQDWKGIVEISAGAWHTVGRQVDNSLVTVGCTGWNEQWGQCEVSGWTNILGVSAGGYHTAGLRADGSVVAAGNNDQGQCNVTSWTNIIQVSAGKWHTVGLRGDGSAVAVGGKEYAVDDRCFIATATYGTPMAEEVEILREFRHAYLLTNPVGRALVDFYYKVSPPMAEFITEHPELKPAVRLSLWPTVAMSAVVVNIAPAGKTAVLALWVLVSVILAIWATRRRSRSPDYT